MYTVYMVINKITWEHYIGCTKDFKRRRTEHKSQALRNRYNNLFHNSIRRYGWNSFIWLEVISGIDKTLAYNIEELLSYKAKLCIRKGQRIGETSKKLMSLIRKGKTLTPEHKNKISKATRGRNNPMYGKRTSRCKPIKCIQNNEPYPSMSQAAKELGLHTSNIRQQLKGNIKQIKGYTFKYIDKKEGD